jgi:hypothetical protein
MRSIGGLVAKCALLAAVLVGVFATSQLSERKAVPTWAPNAKVESAAKPAQSAPAPAPVTAQRLAASDRSCVAQVWPNISKDCITGRVEAERKDARPAGPQPQAAAAAPADPSTTGALPVAATASAPAPSIEPAAQVAPRAPRAREAQRPRKPATRAAASVERPDPSGSRRVREPIQFRLAEGRN